MGTAKLRKRDETNRNSVELLLRCGGLQCFSSDFGGTDVENSGGDAQG